MAVPFGGGCAWRVDHSLINLWLQPHVRFSCDGGRGVDVPQGDHTYLVDWGDWLTGITAGEARLPKAEASLRGDH